MPGVVLLLVAKGMREEYPNKRMLMRLPILLAGGFALLVGVLIWAVAHHFFYREVVIFEKVVDGSGSKAMITCRPDTINTSNGYLVIKRWYGLEAARVELPGKGYDMVSDCRATVGVVDLFIVGREKVRFMDLESEQITKVRLQFGEKRGDFGGVEYVDVPISFFAWEER